MKKIDTNTLTGAAVVAGFALLLLVVVIGSGLNIYNLVLYLRPGDYGWATVAPILFDVAAMVWLGVFIFKARGGWQRLIAGIWCLVTVGAVVAANVYYWDLTSAAYWQALTLANPTPEQVRTLELSKASQALWAMRWVEFAMAWQFVGKILYILADPGIRAIMREQVAEDRTLAEAQNEADALAEKSRKEAAGRIAGGRHANMLQRLGQQTETTLGDLGDKQPVKALTTEHAPIVYQRPATNGNGHSTGHGPNPT